MDAHDRARRLVFLMVVALAAVVIVGSFVETFTADPQEGEGWIGGPIQMVFAGGPLVAVAFGLRSTRPGADRVTAIASLVFAAGAGFVLVMQVLDHNETNANRAVSALVVAIYLAAFAVTRPGRHHRRPDGPRKPDEGALPTSHRTH